MIRPLCGPQHTSNSMIEMPEKWPLIWDNRDKKPRRRLEPSRGVADYTGVDMAEDTCTSQDCPKPHHARGFCGTHYTAWRQANRRPGPCSIEVCKKRVENEKRQLCALHYKRYLKYGDPLATLRPDLGRTLAERFWAKVDKNGPLGCWLWTASLDSKGYGQFIIMRGERGYPNGAHRIVWGLMRGPIPEGLVVDHLCRNRACVNVDHLELVTNEENIRRGLWSPVINARKTHCKRGHAFSEENTYRPPGRPHSRQCLACAKIRAQSRRSTK